MPNTAAVFKQVDVKRAAKGALDAGLPVAQVEIDPDGKITIVVGDVTKTSQSSNPWDEA